MIHRPVWKRSGRDWTGNEGESSQCREKNFERPPESWRTVAQDYLEKKNLVSEAKYNINIKYKACGPSTNFTFSIFYWKTLSHLKMYINGNFLKIKIHNHKGLTAIIDVLYTYIFIFSVYFCGLCLCPMWAATSVDSFISQLLYPNCSQPSPPSSHSTSDQQRAGMPAFSSALNPTTFQSDRSRSKAEGKAHICMP